MKKLFLIASAAVMVSGTMAAFEATEYQNMGFCGFSPNGKIAVSSLSGILTITDYENAKEYVYSSEEGSTYDKGTGNSISDNGIVVGQEEGAFAAWWKNGQWHAFDDIADRMSIAMGVTRNGTRIVGSVAPENYTGDYEGLMLTPCYWDLQEDGTFGPTNLLPFPAYDLTGRVPQYVTAISISEDGNTIAGQIVDYAGGIVQPIVYSLGNNGEWSYTLIHDDLFHPAGFELPEYPGEGPSDQVENFMSPEELEAYEKAVEEYWNIQNSLVYPEQTQFMSDEEYDAYQAALEEFYASWEAGEYVDFPDAEQFMTAEEIAAYNQAVEEYYEAVNSVVYPEPRDFMTDEEWALYQEARVIVEEWQERWNEYEAAYNELCELTPSLAFNNVFLSGDGKTYTTTYSKEMMDWDTWMPVSENRPLVFNLEDNTYSIYDNSINLIVSSVTDDGTILAQKPASFIDPIAFAYILPAGADEFMPLYDYFCVADAEVATWIKTNMSHSMEIYDYVYNEETGEFEEVVETLNIMPTGIPFTNADMSILALTVENVWDFENGISAYGYIFTNYNMSGVKETVSSSYSVSAHKGAILSFKGAVASADVYDLSGCKVFTVINPVGEVATGLDKGVYLVRLTGNDGTTSVAKFAF